MDRPGVVPASHLQPPRRHFFLEALPIIGKEKWIGNFLVITLGE